MFQNEPLLDFTVAANRQSFSRALEAIDAEIRSEKLAAYPIIGGKQIRTQQSVVTVDPSDTSRALGRVHFGGVAEAKMALESVYAGAPGWAATPYERRAEIIRAAAARMREQRLRLAALILREAGKPWKEADADVCEAIDFCEYYAEEMMRLGPTRRTQDVMGEENVYFYQPRGVALVIAPWNFPLAIACGMAVAALVTGNATILKPAEQSSLIATELADILLKSGVPADAFAFLPGLGHEIGPMLVNDPRIDIICFTGSKAVGLEIVSRAAAVNPGQRAVKRVIAEMGGKNAVIIDEDADLDEAVKGVLYSAFGYAGQKCSACSRLIAVGDAYETFMTRLCDAAADMFVGPALDSATLVGPVISKEAQTRILDTIRDAESKNKLAFKGKTPNNGFYVPPTIFRDVSTESSLWKEEVFGPVLACRSAKTFDEALALAVQSEYALTGGLYSRSPQHIAEAREKFKVGNLYINRGCTGALVCRQPFGGFAMSGVGSKAGGPDYLLQFLEPRTVSENTMRRGFAPELPS
jgi:RHH-type proline utilization regulon transcriptional repressor/proline dehydrogenase/delta 1-pyrroline-5-carboxylate dehydrogenase